MARRTSPPFRADHVGSLLRPPALLAARAGFAAGAITADQLRQAEDDAIRDAVRMQEQTGLQSATDGEFRRAEWHTDFITRLGGIRAADVANSVPVFSRPDLSAPARPAMTYQAHGTEVTGKVHLAETIFADHFGFLASAVTTAVPKLTIPSPSMAHFRADISASGYADRDEFRADLASAYAAEIAALAGLGCTYLQLDDTLFAFLNDPAWREMATGFGVDPEHQHEVNLGVVNQALAGRPDRLTVTVHMCRGNYRSAWFSSGGYDFVAEAVFSGLQADGFFLEYDDDRSGTFEPLRFVPDGKIVVLGLVTTKTPVLESKDDLKRRVEQAARFVDADRLCLSPQCGFASTVEGNALTLDQQRAKLELVVETAADLWGS
ncbi:MAG: 5-methyltetrahydropteroyltriglutamate--homocysteine S-methyltransferase [Streptosporangiaceae bacterium]